MRLFTLSRVEGFDEKSAVKRFSEQYIILENKVNPIRELLLEPLTGQVASLRSSLGSQESQYHEQNKRTKR